MATEILFIATSRVLDVDGHGRVLATDQILFGFMKRPWDGTG